jgi:hypothetical protein
MLRTSISCFLFFSNTSDCFQRNLASRPPLHTARSIIQVFAQEKIEDSDGSIKPSLDAYGFDQVPGPKAEQPPQQSDRLRKSLDESAKFKIRNDARFTWLATLLVSVSYAYGCLASDGQDFLEILGIPNGGVLGGLAGVFFSLASIFLFLAPELFAIKKK